MGAASGGGVVTAAQRPDPRITNDDVQAARTAVAPMVSRDVGDYYRGVLASAFRPGGLVARAIADELDAIVMEHGVAPFLLRRLAAEWREGRR